MCRPYGAPIIVGIVNRGLTTPAKICRPCGALIVLDRQPGSDDPGKDIAPLRGLGKALDIHSDVNSRAAPAPEGRKIVAGGVSHRFGRTSNFGSPGGAPHGFRGVIPARGFVSPLRGSDHRVGGDNRGLTTPAKI
jgi:hypothetical protein